MKLNVTFPRVKLTPLAVKSFTAAYFRRNHNRPEKQGDFLLSHIEKNVDTDFGAQFGFNSITSIKDYQRKVPLQHYESLYPWIERSLRGERDVLLRGKIDWFATSSGTTGKNKYIPVTKASLKKNHFRAGLDLMMRYAKNNPTTKIRQGQGLVIGGGFSYNPFTGKRNVGYISAILQQTSPLLAKLMKQPTSKISYLSDWQKKVEKMTETTRKKNITSISGQPSWCSAYLQKMLTITRKKHMLQIRPNFELVIRGGMAIDLYKNIFQKLLPSSKVLYYQVYNASEGFFAAQHENDRDDMLLFVEHAVFYEFIPFDNYLRKDYSISLTLEQIKIGVPYVIAITNNAGLWRYVLGDLIEFTGTNPYTIKITGRTKYYIDVAGECTPLQPIDEAIREAAAQYKGTICEYTVGPGVMTTPHSGHYEIIIEWVNKPSCSEQEYATAVDKLLCKNRAYYNDERYDTKMLQKIKVRFAPKQTFYHRLETRGKLGGQHKVPKVSSDRCFLDEIAHFL